MNSWWFTPFRIALRGIYFSLLAPPIALLKCGSSSQIGGMHSLSLRPKAQDENKG